MDDFSAVKSLFLHCQTPQQRYQKIIELGRSLPPMPDTLQIQENIVQGCQSVVYLHCECDEGRMIFYVASDALISAGLAALLLKAYDGQSPAFILQNKPIFLKDLHIYASLSPGRSNGVASMYLRMQKEAIKYLRDFL